MESNGSCIKYKVDRILQGVFWIGLIVFLSIISKKEMFNYSKVIFGLILITFLTFISIEIDYKKYIFVSELLLVGVTLAAYAVMELINFQSITIQIQRIIVNGLPFYIIAKIIFFLFKNIRIASVAIMTMSYIWALANYYVYSFKGQPILPWDLYAMDTASTVALSYDYSVDKYIVYATVVLAAMWQLSLVFVRKEIRKKNRIYAICEVWVVLVLGLFYYNEIFPTLYGNLWNMQETYIDQGVIGGFLGHIQYMIVYEPDTYSRQSVLESIESAKTISSEGVPAENIIVIMNESFADFRIINNEIISDEYMPFIDSLEENTIKGSVYVPVFGGGTSETEFEILLGSSTLYTSQVPYRTALNHPTESLVSYLSDKGFYTQAFHPYLAENWGRNKAYENLGFDEFLSQEDLEEENTQYIRWCVSDYTDYAKIIEEYEEHNDQKYFMFNVTMQNHGGYEGIYDNFSNTVDLSYYGDFPQAETYLSMIKESDKAFEELVQYFSNIEEPTLICFLGDHFPSIENEFYSLLYGEDISQIPAEKYQLMYVTPLVIWANYDIKEKNIERLSSNYLGLEILQAANLEIAGYDSVLKDVYEEYPVVSKNVIIDSDGNRYHPFDVTDGWIDILKCIQYNRVYD